MRECEYRRIWARTPSPRRAGARSPASRAWARFRSCGFTPPGRLGCFLRGAALLFAHLETFLKTRHEVDHLCRLPLLGLFDLDGFALHLRLDDFHQVVVIIVGVFGRVELTSQVRDELLGHL